ncbi:ABC transporter ATP-binding protein [Sneathiella aquimaris]|uniref:ABC transporter ATP-binding protein n=1 Tax=Sneathiella aquimaris TaxID=2599305 RepID=UPI00146C3E61|nr:oligopeptide/dipeptide ABC transporter ATP-binding protein [Sneathiella aquimaris]
MSDKATETPILEIRNISKKFVKPLDFAEKIAQKLGSDIKEEVVHAVDDVSISIKKGEVVSLVGESGCGKSTLGRMVAGILPQTAGNIYFEGKKVDDLSGAAAKEVALKIQMIFQDPFASLNPRLKVREILGEAPQIHGLVKKRDIEEYLDDVMMRCGLDPDYKDRYPHQFSGGQRQRIGIARALAVQPEFIVCDEAVAALDVSIQAQVLNLFMDLRKQLDLTYLFISHDLGVVEHISDRIVIMYLGRVVESATTEELFENPNHPYTQALLREIPRLNTRHSDFTPIEGEIPSPLDPPSGCHFHPRCPFAKPICKTEIPTLKSLNVDHQSACHLNEN